MATQNQVGNINTTAQSSGLIYLIAGSSTFNATTTFAEVSGLSAAYVLNTSSSADFAMTTDGRLKYTGGTPRKFTLYGFVTALTPGGSISTSVGIGVNGSVNSDSVQPSSSASAVCYPIMSNSIAILNTNDYVSLFLKIASGTGTYTIYGAQIGALSAYGS